MHRYPRDMIGHGAAPPDPAWPGGARIAIQVVLNYEEGGENNLLHGDPASEAFLSEIPGAQPWPGRRHWNMESVYEYGARAGFWRLHRMFNDRGIKLTIYGVATALARSPEQVAAMLAADWEIASHGLRWIEHRDMDADAERAQIAEAVRLHAEVTGAPPRGWYTGRCSMNTVRLTAEHGFDYISDAYDDDLPHWIRVGDQDQLVIPYTLDANDMRFAAAEGFTSGDQFETYLRDTFDTLYAEGVRGSPKMMNVGLHCRIVGRPGRAAGLARFLDYAAGHAGVWFARRIDIAEHWAATHPPVPRLRPSEMDRTAFVGRFGGVFEHSPWVAERAWELELGPAHDTAGGLWNAMARAFRAGSPAAQLDVLRAHPDLAGKLASARRLTADSTAEQASAGLDALTDAERARFTELNAAYTSRHGFPFIIAVRDHDKASILAAFERRLDHDNATEFAEASRQVERIARLRLGEML
ncbi:MAG: allantoinase PuuE [Pseudomonadota bacterium]